MQTLTNRTQQVLEKKIMNRLMVYSIIVILIHIAYIFAFDIQTQGFNYSKTVAPLVILFLYSSYFLLIRSELKFSTIKNIFFILFITSAIASFFNSNGFEGIAMVDFILVMMYSLILYNRSYRIFILITSLLVIGSYVYADINHQELIKDIVLFNPTFTYAFKAITRLAITYSLISTVMEAYDQDRNEIIGKNEVIQEYSQEIKAQNISLQNTLAELKKTQITMVQVEKMASIGLLTAGIAHEINNPLNFIKGGCNALKTHFSDLTDKKDGAKPLFDAIDTGVNRAAAIIKGLNQFNRQNEKLDEECNISSIINNCLLILNNHTKNRIVINNKLESDEFTVKGNVGKLHQVFTNILSNSSQAITDEGKIEIASSKKNKCVEISIKDDGVGVNEENLQKITEPFFTTKAPGKGTGLGLSISHSILQEHKGNLEIESAEGIGTTVRVILPT